jgi:hypothetical protein
MVKNPAIILIYRNCRQEYNSPFCKFLFGSCHMAKNASKVTLIASDSKNPIGPVKKGQKLQVVSVQLAGSAAQTRPTIGSRLCGGTNTCLAVTEV